MRYTILILALVFCSVAHAQSVELATECSNANKNAKSSCNGTFRIANVGLQPLMFSVVDAIKTTHSNGQTVRGATADIDLSQSAGRLGPKEIRELSFRMRCDSTPCSAKILIGFMAAQKIENGFMVRSILPHNLYWVPGSKHPRLDTLKAAGIPVK